jgi:hypothetical protein
MSATYEGGSNEKSKSEQVGKERNPICKVKCCCSWHPWSSCYLFYLCGYFVKGMNKKLLFPLLLVSFEPPSYINKQEHNTKSQHTETFAEF